jgi:hypothetical protein
VENFACYRADMTENFPLIQTVMIEMDKNKLKALVRLLRRQGSLWEKNIRYEIRFFLCGVFSFFSYYIFKVLSKLEPSHINELSNNFFTSSSHLVYTLVFSLIGFIGLFLSIIAVSLFNSLLYKS